MKMLEHARDYLIDYAQNSKCTAWVAKIIMSFLSKNKENFINDLAKELIGMGICDTENVEVENIENNTAIVVIKEMTHISGVNALAPNQRIKFCENINVIYGLNGTGKSSYFRILNEMVGGMRETPILLNVYEDKPQDISVKLKYTINGNLNDKVWDGQQRAIKEINPVRVFDSKYTDSMLHKRESDEFVITPYGLNAFEELNEYIEAIVSKAEEIVIGEENALPIIEWDLICEDSKALFNYDKFSDDNIREISDVFEKLDKIDFEKSISEIKSDISKIQTQNPEDKLKLEESKSQMYEKLITRITKLDEEVKENQHNTLKIIDGYLLNKAKSDEFRKQIEVLNTIPGVDSDEWKIFVSAGLNYVSKLKMDDECPYCHRSYDDKSLSLVKAYAEFIGNDAEKQLNDMIKKLADKRDDIYQWNVEIVTDEKEIDKNISELLINYMEHIKKIKQNLLANIDKKKTDKLDIPKINVLLSAISEQNEKCKKSITLLSDASAQKSMKLQENIEKLTVLTSDKSLEQQKDNLLLLIQKKNVIATQKDQIREVTKVKTGFSNLSKKAHQELITDQLQSVFTKILQELTQKPIKVELKGKNNAGKQQTELAIRNKRDITSILSEGEQKAVALALFLAEIKISCNKSTIILDDPVNSFDHRIIGAFTEQIMDLENQLIIFTHNRLFLDSIETTSKGHVCKGIDSACNKKKGKHIFLYETQSEGSSRKGVIAEKAKETSKMFLDRAEEKLSKSPLVGRSEVCVNIRQAIEEIIDESVFNGQVPNKFSNKNRRINWDELKKLNPDEELIEKLHTIHGRCSGGELHLGTEREENPVEVDELRNMCNTLKQYIK